MVILSQTMYPVAAKELRFWFLAL